MRLFSTLLLTALAVCATVYGDELDMDSDGEVFVTVQKRFVDSRKDGARYNETKFNPTATAVGYRTQNEATNAVLAISSESGNSRSRYYTDDGTVGTQGGQKIRVQTLGITASGLMNGIDGFYSSGTIFVGLDRQKLRHGYDQQTNNGIVTSNESYRSRGSSHNSMRIAIGWGAGKTIDLDNGLVLNAHMGFDYAHLSHDAIRRYGAGPDSLGFPSQSVYEFPLGAGVATEAFAGDWRIRPGFDMTLVTTVGHIKHANRNYRSGFSAMTADGWRTYGIGSGHLGGRISTGVKIAKSQWFDLDMKYVLEKRRKYRDHRIDAGIGIAF